jgi:hypothetical protein
MPFLLRRRGEGALVGSAEGSDWIQLDATGVEVLEHFDGGATIDEVQRQVGARSGPSRDVLSFARNVEALGFSRPRTGTTAAAVSPNPTRLRGPFGHGGCSPPWLR